MKNNYLLSLLFLFNFYFSVGQVGIGTANPQATLDINGTARIRTLTNYTSTAASQDSIMIADGRGNVKITTSKQIFNCVLKSLVKGSFSSSSDITLSLISGSVKIPFNTLDFDINDEFNTSLSTFTPKQDGIYEVTVQIKASNAIGVTTNFGVAILKNNTIVNKNAFANVGVLGINTTPPVRYITTLVQLTSADTLSFKVVSDLLSLSITGNREDCFFTIKQVH
ncbi:hypothetical protein OX283_012180 [Flavobacterium sp. SUN052]|uniref:hypothetical protein n=1 Tax=Flavobacterium sp. SUN052 TaxID=3002441 RepID=UPI00237D3F07|nr:hypothetical protein [Flavobacterium sp. SUN052]MEC4005418.1 hypothetical protein [Flavobacterium sp. SUN052]